MNELAAKPEELCDAVRQLIQLRTGLRCAAVSAELAGRLVGHVGQDAAFASRLEQRHASVLVLSEIEDLIEHSMSVHIAVDVSEGAGPDKVVEPRSDPLLVFVEMSESMSVTIEGVDDRREQELSALTQLLFALSLD